MKRFEFSRHKENQRKRVVVLASKTKTVFGIGNRSVSPTKAMPQGHRKVPFSGKAKKAQMQTKRDRKKEPAAEEGQHRTPTAEATAEIKVQPSEDRAQALMDALPAAKLSSRGGRQQTLAERYELRFKQESKQELLAKRERAQQPLKRIPSGSAELEMDVFRCFPPSCDFPVRPEWTPDMSKAQIDASEAKYFRDYVDRVMDENSDQALSYFELNLETWRQLWRVIEKSDVLLLVADARYPAAMFPRSLYDYVTGPCGKDAVLVLNKVDLIPASVALAWKDYFQTHFPGLDVVFFSSCPSYNVVAGGRKLRGKISMVTEGAMQIYDVVRRKLKEKGSDVDLSSWKAKIEGRDGEGDDGGEKGVVSVGMVGQPNAGKSSLINSLIGKRVVSVSKTPGHTKHFQTILVTKSVVLVDCPGLVFPSLVDKPLQVLLGSFPIAQLREPFSVVQFLAERLDLVKLLKLRPQDDSDGLRTKLSAFDVCELWAENRGYVTARSNRPDVSRAANHILRMALDGKITLNFLPPGYVTQNLAHDYENHPQLVQIAHLLGQNESEEKEDDTCFEESEDDDDEEDEVSEDAPSLSNNVFNALPVE